MIEIVWSGQPRPCQTAKTDAAVFQLWVCVYVCLCVRRSEKREKERRKKEEENTPKNGTENWWREKINEFKVRTKFCTPSTFPPMICALQFCTNTYSVVCLQSTLLNERKTEWASERVFEWTDYSSMELSRPLNSFKFFFSLNIFQSHFSHFTFVLYSTTVLFLLWPSNIILTSASKFDRDEIHVALKHINVSAFMYFFIFIDCFWYFTL